MSAWNSQDVYVVARYLFICAFIFLIPTVHIMRRVLFEKKSIKEINVDSSLKYGINKNEIVYVSSKNWSVIYRAILCVVAVSVITPKITLGDRFGTLDFVGILFLVFGTLAAIAIYCDYLFGICVCSESKVVLRSFYTLFRFVSIPTETVIGCRYMGAGKLKSIDILAGRKTYKLFNIENRDSLIEFITAAATKAKQAVGGKAVC